LANKTENPATRNKLTYNKERKKEHQESIDCLQFYPKHKCSLGLLHRLWPPGEAFGNNCIAYFLGIPKTLAIKKFQITEREKKVRRSIIHKCGRRLQKIKTKIIFHLAASASAARKKAIKASSAFSCTGAFESVTVFLKSGPIGKQNSNPKKQTRST